MGAFWKRGQGIRCRRSAGVTCGAPVLVVALACGCAAEPDPTTLPHLDDVRSAPAAIQRAARAVVRVRTARAQASGSFISSSGLLLTNNHVLGVNVCPREGCFIEIVTMYQQGSTKGSSVVFAQPVAVDVGMDMAIVQLFNAPGGSELATPDFVSLEPHESAELVGQHVTIVGHPEGALKKWSDGYVIDASGEWFQTTAYTLPGDSGSPVLSDSGAVVGVLHRGSTNEDTFASDRVNVSSYATASARLLDAMSRPLPSTMKSVLAETTASDFVSHDLVYLNARALTATLDGKPVDALTLLGDACDEVLQRRDFDSPDALRAALAPCYHAATWIECRQDVERAAYGEVCPELDEGPRWLARFRAVNQLWIDMNGTLDFSAVSFAVSKLAFSRNDGLLLGRSELFTALSAAQPSLDFSLAYYLAAFDITTYGGRQISDFVMNYPLVAHYEFNAVDIAYASTWLRYYGRMSHAQMQTVLGELLVDPRASIGARLAIEQIEYDIDSR